MGSAHVVDPLHAAYLQRAPKVELHVHLEGAVRPQRLLAILHRHGLRKTYRTTDDLAWLFRHDSFEEFLDHYRFVVTSLRDPQDLHDIASDLFAELRAQNVIYAEVLFSAATFVQQGMPWDELLAAVSEADHASRPRGAAHAPYNIVIDLVRNLGPELALQQVESLGYLEHPRVVGVHLGGDEMRFPARWFETAFDVAREARLGRAAHAGEADGAASVRDAVEVLDVQRIGHGIRCLEDDDVVELLLKRGTTLEVCPTSNVQTRIVDDLESHPLPELLERGLNVTLGADDPSYFDIDLTREMHNVHGALGCDLATIDAMTDQGIHAAFRPEAERAELLKNLHAARTAVRSDLGLPL